MLYIRLSLLIVFWFVIEFATDWLLCPQLSILVVVFLKFMDILPSPQKNLSQLVKNKSNKTFFHFKAESEI